MKKLLLACTVLTVLAGMLVSLSGSSASAEPVASATPDRLTCEGYPEKRQFVDAQSWWRPTAGVTPPGTDHGHTHVGACVPERETISGPFTLDVRMILHDPGLQKVNSGTTGTPYTSVVLKDDSFEGSPSEYKMYETGWQCPTPGTCERWRQVTIDPGKYFVTDGQKEIRFRFFSDVLDQNADGTTSPARMTASLNFQIKLDRSTVSTVDDFTRLPYLRGKGWYSKPGSDLSKGGYCEAGYTSVPLPDAPVSGTWTPTVRMKWHGKADDPQITSHEVRIDPDFHNGVPGTIVKQSTGEFEGALSIDTTTLSNGRHKLFLSAACDDQHARNSTTSGILIVGFEVSNATTTPDTQAPSVPANVRSASQTSSSIDLAWDASTDDRGVSGYRVFRDGVLAKETTSLSWTDTSLAANTGYTYTVRAFDAAGNESADSAALTVSTKAASAAGITRTGSTSKANAAGTSHSFNMPPTTTGQVCVASIALNGTKITAVPAGWTLIPNAAVTSASNPKLYGYYHVVGTSAEPASYTWTSSSSYASGGGIACYSGVDTATPIDVSASPAASSTSATSGTVPGVTTTTAGAMLIGALSINSSDVNVAITSTGMAEIFDVGGKRIEADDQPLGEAGASGSRSWTWTTARAWAGWLSALRPAA